MPRRRVGDLRGVVAWPLAAAGLATASAGGAWWSVQSYRVEHSLGLACTISKQIFPTSAEILLPTSSESGVGLADACKAVASEPHRCASVDAWTARRCAGTPDAVELGRRSDVLALAPLGSVPRVSIGWPAVHLPGAMADMVERAANAAGYATYSTGGVACPSAPITPAPAMYMLVGGVRKCLAFRIDDGQVLTAAHCLQLEGDKVAAPRKARISLAKDVDIDMQCTPLRLDTDFESCPTLAAPTCALDVARCTIDAATPAANRQALDRAVATFAPVTQPLGNPFHRPLTVVSSGLNHSRTCLKLDPTKVPVDAAAPGGFVVASMVDVPGRDPVTFRTGDSGGPALLPDLGGGASQAVGVNTRSGTTAYIAPLWSR